VVVTVKVPALPTANVVWSALVIVGGVPQEIVTDGAWVDAVETETVPEPAPP
jgi:hypothetical protein